MQIFIRTIFFALIVFLVEYYFLRKINKSFYKVFKKNSKSKASKAEKIFIVYINIYPAFLLIDWILADVTKAPVLIPQNVFFDWLILFPFWIFMLIAIQSDLLFLIIEFFNLISFPIRKKFKEKIISVESKIILLIVLSFLIYIPTRVIYDYNTIQIRNVEYKKENLPPQLNDFRIVLISDIHADRYTNAARLKKYIDEVNTTNPDLVLIGGDMISSSPEYIDTAAKYLEMIKSKYGTYSCVGDHDNWAYRNDSQKSLEEVEAALKKQNIFMIDDGNKILNINGTDIEITFVTNTYVEHIKNSILDRLTSDTTNCGLKILISHQPKQTIVDKAVKANYDLIFAGHTHGGQITFLFPFKNLTPTMFETKYIRGNFYFGKTLMVVTRRLGMSLIPMRYNSTPEITVINISK